MILLLYLLFNVNIINILL